MLTYIPGEVAQPRVLEDTELRGVARAERSRPTHPRVPRESCLLPSIPQRELEHRRSGQDPGTARPAHFKFLFVCRPDLDRASAARSYVVRGGGPAPGEQLPV